MEINIIEIEKKLDESKGWYIKEIDNPCCSIQLYAVLINPNVIRDIKNPCDKVLKYINGNKKAQNSILYEASNIQYIKNPTTKQQLRVVEDDPEAIYYIKKPKQKVKDYVKKYNKINKNHKSQLKAVKKDGMNLSYMFYLGHPVETVDQEIVLEAIKQNPKAVEYYILYGNYYEEDKIIEYINTDNELILLMIKYNPFFIKEVKNKTREIQLALLESTKDVDILAFATGDIPQEEKIQEILDYEKKYLY